jgi:hypothetical protein
MDLLLQLVKHPLDAFADDFRGARFETIALSSPQADQLATAGDQLLNLGLLFREFGRSLRTNLFCKPCQNGGIEAIRFRQDVEGFGKVTNLARINDSNLVASVSQFRDQSLLVPTRRFHDS